MSEFEKKLFNTDDWLARHPKVIAFLILCCIILVSWIQ